MKFLVLGAGGMAGHVVALYLQERGHEVETLSARYGLDSGTMLLDMTEKERFAEWLGGRRPDVIVNCAGILIRESEARPDLAAYLNAYLPHMLAHRYSGSATRVIHLSTDCVFSGDNGPYREDSAYDGRLFYDRSKALGEIVNDKDLTLRMSIIGPDMKAAGTGLFNWFSQQTGGVPGYTGAVWNGITTIELARGIEAAAGQRLTGLYHLTPAEPITKHDLLVLIKRVFSREDIDILPQEGVVSNKMLINNRRDFDFEIPGYEPMIAAMKAWIDDHCGLYPHYSRLEQG